MYGKNYSCHDGNYHKNDFFLSQTRAAKILVFENLRNNRIPTKPNKIISIGKKGWWRGMIITDFNIYLFSSYYSKKKETARLAIMNRKNNRFNFKRLPVKDGIYWDTIYQASLLEE